MEVETQHQFMDVGKCSPDKRRNSDAQGSYENITGNEFTNSPSKRDSLISESQLDNELEDYLKSKFAILENKIDTDEFENIHQLQQSLNEAQSYCEKNAPGGISRSETIFTYYLNILNKGAEPFCKGLPNYNKNFVKEISCKK